MGFSRQEYWSGLPCPPPGDLPNPGIEPRFPVLQVNSLPAEPPRKSLLNETEQGMIMRIKGDKNILKAMSKMLGIEYSLITSDVMLVLR